MRGILRFSSRTIKLHTVAIIIIGLVASYLYLAISAPDSPKFQSEEGVLDLTQAHISENPLKVNGEWAFYWQELLSPEDIQNRLTWDGNDERWISIPSSWLGYRLDDQQLNGTGFATFRLVIQLSEQDRNERLALRLPTIFHAYKLWVNGELLAEVGVVGQDKSSVTPHLATKLVFFQPENDTVELVMQVANFHHKRGGITKYIELGGSDVLTVKTKLRIAADWRVSSAVVHPAAQRQGTVVFWSVHLVVRYTIFAGWRAYDYEIFSSISVGIAVQDRVPNSLQQWLYHHNVL